MSEVIEHGIYLRIDGEDHWIPRRHGEKEKDAIRRYAIENWYSATTVQREINEKRRQARVRLEGRVAPGYEQELSMRAMYTKPAGPPRPPLAYFHPVEAMIERLADQHDKYGLFLPDPSKPVEREISRLRLALNRLYSWGPEWLIWFIIAHIGFRALFAVLDRLLQ